MEVVWRLTRYNPHQICHHWLEYVAYPVPSHYINHCLFIFDKIRRNNDKLDICQDTAIFSQENILEFVCGIPLVLVPGKMS